MSIGPVMADIQGLELQAEEREMLQHPAVGGVILFSRNYQSAEQVHQLADDIHRLRQPPLLIAVDQEGGRVQRFRDGFFRLPPLRSRINEHRAGDGGYPGSGVAGGGTGNAATPGGGWCDSVQP